MFYVLFELQIYQISLNSANRIAFFFCQKAFQNGIPMAKCRLWLSLKLGRL